MATTSIEWTDTSWNPLRGCSRVSEGCRNCYAEKVAYRFSGPGQSYEGLVREVYHQIGQPKKRLPQWNGNIKFVEKHLLDPLKWGSILTGIRNGEGVLREKAHRDGSVTVTRERPRRVFVNSMSDLFHENVTDEMLDKIFAVMALSPQHTFQVLTKRPKRMRDYLRRMQDDDKDIQCWINAAYDAIPNLSPCAAGLMEDQGWPLPNVWIGTSTENQDTANDRIQYLLETPAAIRFISAEPLLEEINMFAFLSTKLRNEALMVLGSQLPGLDWVIVGGESGPGARPFHIEWARQIVEQCAEAGVACFVKQMGSNPFVNTEPGVPLLGALHLRDKKGGDMSEWPEDLRVRQMPSVA